MSTYVVAYFPDATLNVEAVGPFRSRERAERVCDRLSAAIDAHPVGDYAPSRLPQVVPLISESEAVRAHGSPDGGADR